MPQDSNQTRWIIKLPNEVFFDGRYATYEFSYFNLPELYFERGDSYFKKNLGVINTGLSNTLFRFLRDLAKVFTSKGTPIRYFLLFDGCYDQVDYYYEHIQKCQNEGPALDNLFRYLYIYLDATVAKQFADELIRETENKFPHTEFNVYEATPNLVSGQPIQNWPVLNHIELLGIQTGWQYEGGRGHQASCFVVEVCWGIDNPELPDYIASNQTRYAYENGENETLIDGPLTFSDKTHGTQTLGVLVASGEKVTERDKVGIVPDATIAKLISTYMPLILNENPEAAAYKPLTYHEKPEAALLKAICLASPGDIVLIEYEWTSGGLPFEYQEVGRHLIWYATHCLDITVVEPAGNGIPKSIANVDDQLLDFDSGSILVGAAYESAASFMNGRNYSARAMLSKRFCFAPVPVASIVCKDGKDVDYGQTSAAAAVIAGVACQIQSIYKSMIMRYGRQDLCSYLPPYRLRELLCNPDSSALDVRVSDMLTGTMPDLPRIYEQISAMVNN